MGLLEDDILTAVEIAAGRREVVFNMREAVIYEKTREAMERLYQEALFDPELLITYDIETAASVGVDEDAVLEYARSYEVATSESSPEDEVEMAEVLPEFDVGSLDTKTAVIKTIQFSIAPGTGVSIPWEAGYAYLAYATLALPNPKAGHNTLMFDDRILEREGVVINGQRWDTLWMFHMWQPDLPANLQTVAQKFGMPAPWKHLAGGDLEWYGAADVDAVQRIMRQLPDRLRADGLWESYIRYVLQFVRVLFGMERRGIPVNGLKLAELRGWIAAEVERMMGELQPLIPLEVRPHEKEEPYAGIMYVPIGVRTWLKENHPGVRGVAASKQNAVIKSLDLRDEIVTEALNRHGLELRRDDQGDEKLYRISRELFNPGSPKQLLAYLKHKGHPIPLRFKDGKETTGDKELDKLERSTGDPVIKLTREIRAVSKLGNAYCGKIGEDGIARGGWVPSPDGRLRATFTGGSAVWQLTAYNPNVLTTPKRRAALAKRFGACIEAPIGFKLIQFDFQSFHALMTGREAQDASYMRLARLDVHSFVAGHMVKFPGIGDCLGLPDEDLRLMLQDIKKKYKTVRDNQAKPAVHGTNFGQGFKRLYYEYREHFKSEGEAKQLLLLLQRLFPKLFIWQRSILLKADEQGYLVSNWGARRYFHDIYTWRKNKFDEWVNDQGKDAEKAKAFLPSNHAHGMMREKLLWMEQWGWNEKYGLVNVPHDAIWLVCPEDLVDECIANVKPWLEAPVLQLRDEVVCPEGFVCGTDVAVGINWASMEEVKV